MICLIELGIVSVDFGQVNVFQIHIVSEVLQFSVLNLIFGGVREVVEVEVVLQQTHQVLPLEHVHYVVFVEVEVEDASQAVFGELEDQRTALLDFLRKGEVELSLLDHFIQLLLVLLCREFLREGAQEDGEGSDVLPVLTV